MHAERIDLDDDSVDGVLCQSGYMLMADVEAALAETRRVLRPGRRLAMSVWGAPERNPWASIPARILVESALDAAAGAGGDPASSAWRSEERTRALLAGAGFGEIRTDEVQVLFRFRDVDDYVGWAIDMGVGPIAMVLRRALPGSVGGTVTARLEEGFAPFSADGGYVLLRASRSAPSQADTQRSHRGCPRPKPDPSFRRVLLTQPAWRPGPPRQVYGRP